MTQTQLIVFVVVVVLLASAATGVGTTMLRHQAQVRRKAAAARRAQTEAVEAAQQAEQRRRRQFQDRPQDPIYVSYLHFLADEAEPLNAQIEAVTLEEARAREAARQAHARASQAQRYSAARRLVLPFLAVFWLILFGLQVLLDIQIMHGLFPDNPIIAYVLATSAAIMLTGGALWWTLMLGGHDSAQEAAPPPEQAQAAIEGQVLSGSTVVAVPSRRRQRRRRLYIAIWGGALLLLLVGALVSISPFRSRGSNVGADVLAKTKVLENTREQFEQGNVTEAAVAIAQADLDAAVGRLERAENIDRLYAALVPTVEIVLSFPAVSAGNLVLLLVAARRGRRLDARAAGYETRAARLRSDLRQASDRWQARMAAELLLHDVPVERLGEALKRINGPATGLPAADSGSPPAATGPADSPPLASQHGAEPPVEPTVAPQATTDAPVASVARRDPWNTEA